MLRVRSRDCGVILWGDVNVWIHGFCIDRKVPCTDLNVRRVLFGAINLDGVQCWSEFPTECHGGQGEEGLSCVNSILESVPKL